jgi:hypothetical protein
MTRLICVLSIVLGFVTLTAGDVRANGDARSVAGAAGGQFAAGAELGPVSFDAIQIGTGVFIEADGSASGTFHAVLSGTSLGLAREVTVEGNVNAGTIAFDGGALFSGTASLDLGDGAPPLPNIAFSVSMGPDSVGLVIDSVPLPAAAITAGVVVIE